jgi:glycine cleavage system aminomethyltransferase T
VQGSDAGALLNRLSTANVDGDVGKIVYTQWLNHGGTLEADLTVAKLAEDRFMVVATDTAHRHVESHMARHFADEAAAGAISGGSAGAPNVVVTDVTGGLAQFNVQGPKSRALMQALCPESDMSDSAFPFLASRVVALGYARVTVSRITYLGELGYELQVPTEQAVHVYDTIVAEGKREEHGLVHAGLKALASLRMEKGYRDYGHDMDNTDTLLEAGLGFTADYEKEGGFIGMEAVQAQKAAVGSVAKLPKRMIQVLLDAPEPFLHHGEVVWRNGEIVGDVRAGSFGHTLGSAVGLVMCESADGAPVNKAYVEEGNWEVDIAGVRHPAKASLRPLYDPRNEQIKI